MTNTTRHGMSVLNHAEAGPAPELVGGLAEWLKATVLGSVDRISLIRPVRGFESHTLHQSFH